MKEPIAPDGGPVCTCPLIDVSLLGMRPEYLRGDPAGCPRHDDGRAERLAVQRKEAEMRARYGS